MYTFRNKGTCSIPWHWSGTTKIITAIQHFIYLCMYECIIIILIWPSIHFYDSFTSAASTVSSCRTNLFTVLFRCVFVWYSPHTSHTVVYLHFISVFRCIVMVAPWSCGNDVSFQRLQAIQRIDNKNHLTWIALITVHLLLESLTGKRWTVVESKARTRRVQVKTASLEQWSPTVFVEIYLPEEFSPNHNP